MFADNPLLSRTLAILLLALVIAGAWILLIAPVFEKQATYRDEIDRSKQLIQAFEARQEKVGMLRQELDTLRNDRSRKAAYFTARNATLAAAKLQSRIKSLTQAAGARLTSSQVLSGDTKKGELQRVTVRAHMVGSVEAVRSVFHTLETAQPYVFIDNVTISSSTTKRSARNRKGNQGRNGQLTVRYEAYGFLWRENES
jgi:general secretion pathway protein M